MGARSIPLGSHVLIRYGLRRSKPGGRIAQLVGYVFWVMVLQCGGPSCVLQGAQSSTSPVKPAVVCTSLLPALCGKVVPEWTWVL